MKNTTARVLSLFLLGTALHTGVRAENLRGSPTNTANGAAPALAENWTSVGPSPTSIAAAIAAHAPSHTIYIGTGGGGVLKSTDGGVTFVALHSDALPPQILSLVMDPHNPNVVYAGGAKTTDGGATWTPQSGGGGFSMVMDPTNPRVIYSGLLGVDKTVDGGRNWVHASNGMPDAAVFSLAVNPFSPNVVFAGTTGSGAYRSIDGATTWAPIKIDSTVYGLYVDPDDGNIVYAGTNGKGVYKSTDGGDTFHRVGSPRVPVVFSIAKSDGRLYAGTAGGGVSVSDDGGMTWRSAGVTETQGLVVSVDSAGAVYLGTSFDGAFVLPVHSTDHWRRLAWQELKSCACQQGHALSIDPSDHNHVFFSTNDGGLLVTHNGGGSWQDGGSHGLVARAPRSVAFDPQDPRRVYVSSIAGGLFKSKDGGEHWQRRRFGAGTNYTTGVAVDPVTHAVYVGTIDNLGILGEGIWKSADFGETFTRIDRAPHAPPGQYLGLSGRGITIDPHQHDVVYFADRKSGIWRSRNGGAGWLNVEPAGVYSVTVDPSDSNVVYAGGVSGVGVLKSTDGGSSFMPMNAGLLDTTTSRTGSVQVNPQNPNVLYVATEGAGVFKSTDGAQNWFPINKGLADVGVFGLAMDPLFPSVLYASTNSSVYKRRGI